MIARLIRSPLARFAALAVLAVAASDAPAHAWGRNPNVYYIPGYGWNAPSSPALYGYAPYGFYADYGTYFRGVPMEGWSGQHTYPGAAETSGLRPYGVGFGAYSGGLGYPGFDGYGIGGHHPGGR